MMCFQSYVNCKNFYWKDFVKGQKLLPRYKKVQIQKTKKISEFHFGFKIQLRYVVIKLICPTVRYSQMVKEENIASND